jgi:hypothetical protein
MSSLLMMQLLAKNGHCLVPRKHKKEKHLGRWVNDQQQTHAKHKMRPDRKKLLDEHDLVWKAGLFGRTRSSSAAAVRRVVIGSFHAQGSSFFLTLNSVSVTCSEILFLEVSQAAWVVSQAKRWKKPNQREVPLESDQTVHLPTESEEMPAVPPTADKWTLGQTKEARLEGCVGSWWVGNEPMIAWTMNVTAHTRLLMMDVIAA